MTDSRGTGTQALMQALAEAGSKGEAAAIYLSALVQAGVITEGEAQEVRAEMTADGDLDDDDEHCNWCQRGGEMQSFEGRLFCGEDCANSYWYEWGHDD